MTTPNTYYVYIHASGTRTLYIGLTTDLHRRMEQHRARQTNGFTSKYGVDQLVYFEATEDAESGAARERQLKGWRRSKKLGVIDGFNPTWRDLVGELLTG